MPNVIIVRNEYPNDLVMRRVLHYALEKATKIGGYGISSNAEAAFLQMWFVKRIYYQTDALQLKHFFITLSDTEAGYIGEDELLQLGFLAGQIFGEYQMVYGIHHDGSHEHLHIVMNTTSFLDGHQYSDGLSMFNRLCEKLRQMYPRFEVHLGYTRWYYQDDPYCNADRGQFKMLN